MEESVFAVLLKSAVSARQNAYCPISNFAVGAAIRTIDGDVFAGCNVEEPAFNHTIHAEQNCVAQMVAKLGRKQITDVVVVGAVVEQDDTEVLTTPCGHCRQLLVEFADDNARICVASVSGKRLWEGTLGELLPHAFRMNAFKP